MQTSFELVAFRGSAERSAKNLLDNGKSKTRADCDGLLYAALSRQRKTRAIPALI